MMSHDSPPAAPALRAREAATFLQRHLPLDPPWSAARVWKYARAGVLPCVRVGQALYFPPAALLDWLAKGGSGYAAGWRRKPGPKPGPKLTKARRARRGA